MSPLDEVGNGDLDGAAHIDNERYLSLTGIITRLDLHQRRFQPDVLGFKTDIFGPDIGQSLVLHRREIVRREGQFKVLRDDGLKARFDSGLLSLFADFPI
jgi:hypothetical protein